VDVSLIYLAVRDGADPTIVRLVDRVDAFRVRCSSIFPAGRQGHRAFAAARAFGGSRSSTNLEEDDGLTGRQASTAEHARLAEATGAAEDDPFEANPWYEWGPHLSERACGSSPTGWSASGSRDPTVADPSTAASTSCSPDPAWKDHLLFYEHFHGDNGAGLGAMHQTGLTALVADLILARRDTAVE